MIIAIVGPTGVGKTKMSIEIAKWLNAPIINCDAVQIYKGLNIGSAKVTDEEKENIKHYLIDIKNPDENYTVKDYQEDARKIIKKYENSNIIFCGGTGLYLSAALMNYKFYEDENNVHCDNLTNEELYELALKKDKSMTINKNNRVRLIRFLNKKIIEKEELKNIYDNVIIIGLTTNRNNLYKIINDRVDKMFNDGLVAEVKELNKNYPNSRVLKTAIGYKEVLEYINKTITLDECIDKIKKASRHYAKRQYTWFNNKMKVTWFEVDYENFNNTIKEVKEYISNCKK